MVNKDLHVLADAITKDITSDYAKENPHNPITCVPGNTQPPR